MQGSTGKFTEMRVTQNRLSYAESRTLMNPDEHILSDLKSVQDRCEVAPYYKQKTQHHRSSLGPSL
jgi:hypothetical protein